MKSFSVWVSRRRRHFRNSLVDEIVSHIGEQQPTGLWDEVEAGVAGPARSRSAGRGHRGQAADGGRGGSGLAGSIQLLSRQLEEQSRLIPRAAPPDPAPGQPARPGAGSSELAEPSLRISQNQVASMKKVQGRGSS